MEFQTAQNEKGGTLEDYFLQYHRTRDQATPPHFTLDRDAEQDEVEALLTREATPEEGIQCDLTVLYENYTPDNLPPEEAGLDLHWDLYFTEAMTRRRIIQISDCKSPEWLATQTADGHLPKSKLFKPQISIVLPKGTWLDQACKKASEKIEKGKTGAVKIRVISDGTRSLVKFLFET